MARKNLRAYSIKEKRSAWAGAFLGIGFIAAVDELVFHQILGWHHFYDLATPRIGLLSDGLLHAAELVLLVTGFFLIMDLRRRAAFVIRGAWAGFFIGAGGFQVFDGVINHKILRLHQIRYGVYLLPYDLAWILGGLSLIALGLVLMYLLRLNSQSTIDRYTEQFS